jgi:hypothetical protein
MRRTVQALGLVFFSFSISAAARASFVETFDGGGNTGGWSYGTGNEVIEPTGGNPGAYLHDPIVDTFAPQPATTLGVVSPFVGNYRVMGVIRVGIDLITHAVDFSAEGRPLSLILYSDNSTPGNFDDDWGAYTIGPTNIPLPGQGWVAYDFVVPSQSTTLPPGWTFIQFGGSAPPPNWLGLINKVSQLRFFYGNPEKFFIFQQWDIGLDDPRIVTASPSDPPGRIPSSLRLDRLSPTSLLLEWETDACGAATDYGIYEGTLGSWYSHGAVPGECSDSGGDLEETITPAAGDTYYLVVPLKANTEGSYGLDSDGDERPRGTAVCVPAQSIAACP